MGDVAVDTGQKALPGTMFDKMAVDAKTGLATIVTPIENLEKAQQAMTFMDNAMVEMQKEGDRIAAQEQQARSRNPVLAALSSVASHLGSQPDMPGFVRGLAGANREMNPDPDMLAMKKLPLYMQVAKLAQDRTQLGMAGVKMQADIEGANANRELVNWQKTEAEGTKRQGQLRQHIDAGTLNTTIARSLLGPKADEAEVQAYVAASEERKSALKDEATLRAQDRTLRGQQIALNTELGREKLALSKASLDIRRAVGSEKAAVYEAQARNYLANAGYKEMETANAMSEYALKLAQYERGTEKMQLDAAVALAALPWIDGEKKKEYQAKIDQLGKKFGTAPAAAQPVSPAERAGTGGDRGGMVTIKGPGGIDVQVRPMGDGRYMTSDRKIVKQEPSGRWVVVGRG